MSEPKKELKPGFRRLSVLIPPALMARIEAEQILPGKTGKAELLKTALKMYIGFRNANKREHKIVVHEKDGRQVEVPFYDPKAESEQLARYLGVNPNQKK